MRYLKSLLVFFALVSFTACGTTSDRDHFVENLSYDFTTTSDIQLPITQENDFAFNDSSATVRESTYIIEDNDDLDSFNSTLPAEERLSLDDLNTFTYFLISVSGCQNSYVYVSGSYSSNVATITIAHFFNPELLCIQSFDFRYLLFKAEKIP